jgi:hypothetical protein
VGEYFKMSTNAGSTHHSANLSVRGALGIILILGIVYTAHFASYQHGLIYDLLRFVPGLLGVCVLFAAGFTTKTCYLRMAPLSMQGFLVYIAMLVLMTPVVVTGVKTGGWAGIDLRLILIDAPVDAIAQELYFRAALLPALLLAMPRAPRLALGLQALIFAVYHVGMFRVAPAGAAVSAMLVTFLAGIGWGWQVKRDGTVIWAMVHHTLLQIILKLFVWS